MYYQSVTSAIITCTCTWLLNWAFPQITLEEYHSYLSSSCRKTVLNCDIYLGGVTGRFIELLFVFEDAVFCCSQICRTKHRHIVIFTKSNLIGVAGRFIELLFVFEDAVFCCSQICRTKHRHIVIFTKSNLIDSKGCQPFK